MSISTRVTAPTADLLDLAEVKAHLRAVEFTDDDALIEGLVATATGHLDAEPGILGRALITQTWALTMASPPAGTCLVLPIPAVQEVSAIKYFDADDAEQTFAADQYRLIPRADDALVELVPDASWPDVGPRSDAFRVEYVTGYGDVASDVPQPIRQAALLLVAHWYDNREATRERSFSALPMGVRSLLMNYRLARGHM